MDIREFTKKMIAIFFITFTCIILAMTVYYHMNEIPFRFPRDIVAVFVITTLTTAAEFVLYSKKEPKKREMFIRHIIHLFAIIGITLSVAVHVRWVIWSVPITVINFMGLVIGIYLAVHAIDFYQSKKLTDELNKKIKERYRR